MTAEEVKDLGAIEEPKHFEGRLVAQTFPAVRVNMIHHETDVVLGKRIKRFAFRDEKADEFMVAFRRTLLPGCLGIAVKDPGAPVLLIIEFDGGRIGEFAAVVSQNAGEDLAEHFSADTGIDLIEDFNDRLRIIEIAEKSEHEFRLDKMDR